MITDLVFEGNGVRFIRNGSVVQAVWGLENGVLKLSGLSQADVDQISREIIVSPEAISLQQFLIGGTDYLIGVNATDIGQQLSQNVWTPIKIYEHQSSNHKIDISYGGYITVRKGIFRISFTMLLYDASATAITLFSRIFDVNSNAEVPFSLAIDSKRGAKDDSVSIRSAIIVEAASDRQLRIEVMSDVGTTYLGAFPGQVPTGSTNYAMRVLVNKIG